MQVKNCGQMISLALGSVYEGLHITEGGRNREVFDFNSWIWSMSLVLIEKLTLFGDRECSQGLSSCQFPECLLEGSILRIHIGIGGWDWTFSHFLISNDEVLQRR